MLSEFLKGVKLGSHGSSIALPTSRPSPPAPKLVIRIEPGSLSKILNLDFHFVRHFPPIFALNVFYFTSIYQLPMWSNP